MHKIIIGALIVILAASAASADVISVNFQGGQNPSLFPGPGVTATAGYVAVGNWNNAAGESGTLSSLLNDSGTTTGAAITFDSAVWDYQNGDGNGGDQDMMSGFLDNWQTGTGSLTVSGISYDEYDVYVYFNRIDLTYLGFTANDTVKSETLYAQHSGTTYAPGGVNNGYTISTDDNVADGWTIANVVRFSGFSGSTFSLDDAANPGAPSGYKGIVSSIQIVGVPEPMSAAALMGLVCLGFGVLRRRR